MINNMERTLMTIYRVFYPLITSDSFRDFSSKEEADTFYQERLKLINSSPYYTMHDFNRLHINVMEK